MRVPARRTRAVVAGVLLVLVPTLFTVFPEWAHRPTATRIPVLAVWLIAAVVVIRAGAQQNEDVGVLVGSVQQRRDEGRLAAGRYLLRASLLPEATGFPDHYEFRLFVPDRSSQRLVAEFEPPQEDASEGWAFGQGVTGAAWLSASYVRAHGASLSDPGYGLTPEQQARYRRIAVVAAAPVLNARMEPVAVLSVSSEIDDGFVFGGGGEGRHAAVAEAVARILIDILGTHHD